MYRLKCWLKGISKDRQFNYHMYNCPLRSHRFTVIKNTSGMKIWEQSVKFCPCCGTKLKDK